MSKILLKNKALELRKRGLSYSAIKKELGVSKSTLSLWLKGYPLSKEQIDKLLWHNERRIEKYRNTRSLTKAKKHQKTYEKAQKKFLPLTKKEINIAGLFLYWGEGGKTSEAMTVISNTDPQLIQFAIYWLEQSFGINKNQISAKMHLYKDMNEEKIIAFWIDKLKLKREQFKKSYIKNSTLKSLTQKGHGFGTCNIQIGSVEIKRQIMMGIKAIADYYTDNDIISTYYRARS